MGTSTYNNGARVAVTGIGLVTPIGHDRETVWSSLVEGASGVGEITLFDTAQHSCKIAAEVKGFNPENWMDRKTARHVGRYIQFALAATQQALDQSGLNPRDMDPDAVGVIISTGIGGMDEIEKGKQALMERGVRRISPFMVPMMIPDMAAGVVAMQYGAGGLNYAIVSACASSAHGIGEAAEVIKRGDATAMLAGGAEATITPLTMGAFCQIHAVSERNDEPERACRPFDKGRDGFVMGEGSVMLVLEDWEHAERRDAPILAEIVGYGASADAHHVSSPPESGDGAARSMQQALDQAGLRPDEGGYLNAHATSTGAGDIAETNAIKQVFGQHAARLPISSTKSMTGHLLGAAGAIETVFCILAMRESCLPPTINQEHPDPACDLDYVPNRARAARVSVALNNSFGFGGQNASLVLRLPD